MPPQTMARIPHAELEKLQARLAEAEETLDAIRSGAVDALVVHAPRGDQLFTLQGAEQPYRIFVEHMQQGAVTLSPDGTILYANGYFAAFVNLPLQKLIGSRFFDLLSPEDATKTRKMMDHPFEARGEITLQITNAPPRPVRVAFHKMDLPDNPDVLGLVVTDLSVHHERERLVTTLEELRRSEEQLRHHIEALTSTRTQLEEASRAKDHFLAALSHELRTPLTPVLLSAVALASDPHIPDDLRGEFAMMRRNIELEARLIDDLLDLTRIARGQLDIHAQPANTHELLGNALEICSSDLRSKSLQLISDFDADEPWVSGDPVRIQQVFWNLLRNAVKFTPKEGTIRIKTSNVNNAPHTSITLGSPTSFVMVEITDTGIGMAPQSIPPLFNAFEQEHASHSQQFGGLGLGLSISKKIIDLHHGQILAASAGPGQGATFTVYLPTIPAPIPFNQQRRTILRDTPASPLHILVVEDHEDTRRNMWRFLTALKHDVDTASNAAEALALASQKEFDLVISDVGLPDRSGFDLMRELHDTHRLKGICLSGFGMESDIAKAYSSGFSTHLTKPINFHRLEQAISNVMNNSFHCESRSP